MAASARSRGPGACKETEDRGARRLRIVLVGDSFPRNMGYLGTMLPKYLASLGAEVHYVSGDLPPYWQIAGMREHYVRLIGAEWMKPGLVAEHDGYTVHVLPHGLIAGHVHLRGLMRVLRDLRPDVVYSLTAVGLLPLELALGRVRYGYRLFTGSHLLASGFPLARKKRPWLSAAGLKTLLTRWLPGRAISLLADGCVAPTSDCADIARRFLGVQRHKITVMHLGVDTEVFRPVSGDGDVNARVELRQRLGVSEAEVLCVYTGKLTREKGVLFLAQTIARLREAGFPLRLLAVGEGPEAEAIADTQGARVLPFQPYRELGPLYRAADIAVWPTNESTSMLDAAACGLPLIVSDAVHYREHVDGNGLVFRLGDSSDLEDKLRQLCDWNLRQVLGMSGARKMRERFGWDGHARRRLAQYRHVLER